MDDRTDDQPIDTWLGRTAVITGAANGIGLAMARRFARAGMRLALADRDVDALGAAADLLRSGGADVLAVETDVRDPAALDALASAVATTFGDVHLLCNNAGVIRPGRVWETSADDWSTVLDVNVAGVVNGLRSFVPTMLAHGESCHVVNTSSAAGWAMSPSFAAYCVSKAAVIAVSEALAGEVALLPEARLRVHVLCPGSTATNLYRAEVERRSDVAAAHPRTTEAVAADGMTAERWAATSSAERNDQVDPALIVDALWQALAAGTFYVLPIQASMRDAARSRLDDAGAAIDAVVPIDVPGGAAATAIPAGSGVLREYFALVDGPTPERALELVADDLRFAFSRPDGGIEGGRQQLADYLSLRRPLGHRLDHQAFEGAVEFVAGQSTDGDTDLGAFLAAVHINGDGRIDEYLAAFHPGRRFAV